MPKYRFPIQSDTGVVVDDTEPIDLPDDTAARNYGQSVIDELNEVEPRGYFGWTMDIKEGERLVAIFPCNKLN